MEFLSISVFLRRAILVFWETSDRIQYLPFPLSSEPSAPTMLADWCSIIFPACYRIPLKEEGISLWRPVGRVMSLLIPDYIMLCLQTFMNIHSVFLPGPTYIIFFTMSHIWDSIMGQYHETVSCGVSLDVINIAIISSRWPRNTPSYGLLLTPIIMEYAYVEPI